MRDHCFVLTGGRDGAVVRAFEDVGPAAAQRALSQMVCAFGAGNVLVELWDHGDPVDTIRNDHFVRMAAELDLQCVATNNVSYAVPAQHRLATAFAAVNQRAALDDVDHRLSPAATAYLRSGAEQERRFARYPGVVRNAALVGAGIAFDLSLVAPSLPPFPCPEGLTEMQHLRNLVDAGATRRYGMRPPDSAEDLSLRARAWRTIDHELRIIEALGFAGYFLVVWDIVRF